MQIINFIFKTINNVLDVLCSGFKNYCRDYILETLQQNSLDIAKTYICLKDPMKSKIIRFTPLDDKFLLRKRVEEYKNLVEEKGKNYDNILGLDIIGCYGKYDGVFFLGWRVRKYDCILNKGRIIIIKRRILNKIKVKDDLV